MFHMRNQSVARGLMVLAVGVMAVTWFLVPNEAAADCRPGDAERAQRLLTQLKENYPAMPPDVQRRVNPVMEAMQLYLDTVKERDRLLAGSEFGNTKPVFLARSRNLPTLEVDSVLDQLKQTKVLEEQAAYEDSPEAVIELSGIPYDRGLWKQNADGTRSYEIKKPAANVDTSTVVVPDSFVLRSPEEMQGQAVQRSEQLNRSEQKVQEERSQKYMNVIRESQRKMEDPKEVQKLLRESQKPDTAADEDMGKRMTNWLKQQGKKIERWLNEGRHGRPQSQDEKAGSGSTSRG